MRPGLTLTYSGAYARRHRRLMGAALGVLVPSIWLALATYVAPVASAERAALVPVASAEHAALAPAASAERASVASVRYVTSADGLNLRASPGGAVRDTLPDRAAVSVLAPAIDEGGERWYPVAVATSGQQGWLAGGYLAEAAPPLPVRALEVRLQGGGRATIDALEDGQVVRSMPAYAGGATAATPTGTFAVQARVESLTTNMWAAKSGHEWQLPYFLQVDGDVGIHGPKIDLRTGLPVPGPSSGCLSPSHEDSVWLFGWAAPGTPVHITRG